MQQVEALKLVLWGDAYGVEPTIAKKCLMQTAPNQRVAYEYMSNVTRSMLQHLDQEERQLMSRAASMIERNDTRLSEDKKQNDQSEKSDQSETQEDSSGQGVKQAQDAQAKSKGSQSQEQDSQAQGSQDQQAQDGQGQEQDGQEQDGQEQEQDGQEQNGQEDGQEHESQPQTSQSKKMSAPKPLTAKEKQQLQNEINFAKATLAEIRDILNARTSSAVDPTTIMTDLELATQLGVSVSTEETRKMLSYIQRIDLKVGSAREEPLNQMVYSPHHAMSLMERASLSQDSNYSEARIREGILVDEYMPSQARINLVLDRSGSMSHDDRLAVGKAICAAFYLALTEKERSSVDFFLFSNTTYKTTKEAFFSVCPNGATSLCGLERYLKIAHRDVRWIVVTDGDIPDLDTLNLPKCVVVSVAYTRYEHPNLVLWDSTPTGMAHLRLKMRQLLK